MLQHVIRHMCVSTSFRRLNSYIPAFKMDESQLKPDPITESIISEICMIKKPVLGYISDMRLERHDQVRPYDIVRNCDYLAMCGNNGDPFNNHYRELLVFASMNFEHTVFIAGNHEYDKVKYPEIVIDRLRNISHDLPNVEFLNRDTTNINGYTIMGATLCKDDEYSASNEYNPTNKMYMQDVNWLTQMIDSDSNKKIVLTCREPKFQLQRCLYEGLPHQFNFYNNPDNVSYKRNNIYAWLYGQYRGKHSKYHKPVPELIQL